MSAESVRTEALVLRRFDFSETSQTGRLFTRSHGRLGVLAKGIKRPQTRLRGPMDLFAWAKVEVRLRRRSDLHLLVGYQVQTGFPGLRRELERLYGAFYVTEVLREGTRDADPEPRLFDLGLRTLHVLEVCPPAQVAAVASWFDLAWLGLAGFLPAFDRCMRCGQVAPETGPVRFAPAWSGLACRRCAARQPLRLWTLDRGQRDLLALLLRCPTPEAVLEADAIVEDSARIRDPIDRIMQGTLEIELKSAASLREGTARR